MKTAKSTDWNTEALPDKHVTLDLQLSYSKKDQQKIVKGLVPKVMEDKWFVYFDGGVLNFHRSWTGFCVYRVYAHDSGEMFTLTHADVNREQSQYKETNDEIDRQMISYLIDVLLLRKPARFPYNNSNDEQSLKIWSSVGKALFAVEAEEASVLDFVRIIPAQRYVGYPAPLHRPYAFYADAASLLGRTIAESYSLVKGLGLPNLETGNKHCSPFIWNDFDYTRGDYDTPLADIKVRKTAVMLEGMPIKKLEQTNFVVLRTSRAAAIRDLDVFPATWRALSYIVSDPRRMGVHPLTWGMSPEQFASARIHALFKEVQAGSKEGLLALNNSKEMLGLTDLERLPQKNEEFDYYTYLSKDSGLTNNIVDLFGISSRCWHGCGYLGSPGNPLCRFFLLRNIITSGINISVMSGKDILN
jgi:hypothetical protein